MNISPCNNRFIGQTPYLLNFGQVTSTSFVDFIAPTTDTRFAITSIHYAQLGGGNVEISLRDQTLTFFGFLGVDGGGMLNFDWSYNPYIFIAINNILRVKASVGSTDNWLQVYGYEIG